MHKQQHAAVSLIEYNYKKNFFDREIIFIKRAISEMDPWSGHCALPGGGVESVDQDIVETAIRETKEEIGLPLSRVLYQRKLCKLIPRKVFNNSRLHLSCLVFKTEVLPIYYDVSEVSDIFTVPVGDFFNEKNFSFNRRTDSLEFISAMTNYKIWGLTLALIFEYLYDAQPLLIRNLSFFDTYHKRKNSILELSYGENISIES